MAKLNSPGELERFRQELSAGRDPDKPCISICAGTGCLAGGAAEVIEAFKTEIGKQGPAANVDTKGTGCPGFCEKGPVVVIYPEEICYLGVTPEDVPEIVAQTIGKKKVIDRLVYTDPKTGERATRESDIPFYKFQNRNLLSRNTRIDSRSIDDYLAIGGYSALSKALLRMTAEEVLEEVKKSNIRGRGGGGFPAGRKWEGSRNAPEKVKYVLVNADEGDPGAFMDRALLEGNPHSILEGLIIGGYAVGAHEGYVYVRQEYPLAVKNITLAIEQAEKYGFLGENILGSGFDFTVKVHQGAGAFVCGESTALMTALEGRAGEPRPKYVRSNVRGLWGRPTVLNNVETWANVPLIVNNGADWFAQFGTEGSKGTKIFSLVGKIANTGLVEVPMGMALKDIIYKIGGGIPGGKKFKAVQTGGPSGGCIPESLLDLGVDFDELTKAGSMMGSGGMIVMDEDTCMVDVARYFIRFLTDESCGKCVPCREGLRQMDKILKRITEGGGKEGDIEMLEELSDLAIEASLCALGKSAPNPFLSTLRYFKDEYLAHIREGACAAGVCQELVHSPCENECPAGVDVPLYISLIKEGRLEEALASHLERNPLPGVCARVCPHPCESKCRRRTTDSPVAIRSIKRYMADNAPRTEPARMVRENPRNRDRKIAVVGSGPAGLSCAYFMRRMGYPITIFEKEEEPGGMMAYAIPEYRLPRDILRKDIEWILGTGIELVTGKEIGRDLTIEDLKSQGYRAIFLGLGAWEGMNLGVPGEDAEGVVQGLDFLVARSRGKDFPMGGRVAVIGGGDVAVDSARMAHRTGAAVTVVYRRTRGEMPAIESEIEEAEAEGIKFIFLAAPEKVEADNGRASRLVCRRMKLSEYGIDGRRRPAPTDELFEIGADTVIAAIGQRPVTAGIAERSGIAVGRGGRIQVDAFTNETSVPVIYAGGDVVTGPSIVPAAVGAGERAAVAMNEALSRDLAQEDRSTPFWRTAIPNDVPFDPAAEPVSVARMKHETLPLEERTGFEEVDLAVSRDVVLQECGRCLRCDYREKSRTK